MPSGSQKWQRKIPPIVDDSIDYSPIEPLKPPLSSGFSIATFHDRRVSIWAHVWPTRAVAPDSSSRHGNEGRPTRVIDYELPMLRAGTTPKKNKSATQHI